MDPAKFVMAKDGVSHAQFAHLYTEEAENITASVVLNATFDLYVSIVPTGGSAYIYVTTDGLPLGQGKYIDGEYATIIRAGEYLGASAEINVCPIGELPSA